MYEGWCAFWQELVEPANFWRRLGFVCALTVSGTIGRLVEYVIWGRP